MFQNKRKGLVLSRSKGFTLIEMLIVIGILAILVAAVIIAINPAEQFKNARNATRWSHMNAIANAVYGYVIDEAGWPTYCPKICTGVAVYTACSATTTCPFATSTGCTTPLVIDYLPKFPEDPQGGSYQVRFYDDNETRIQICPSAEAIAKNTDTPFPEVIQ